MTKEEIITPEILRQLLEYDSETGNLTWRRRCVKHFATLSSWRSWNTRYAGKEALTADCNGYRHGYVLSIKTKAHRAAWAIHYGALPKGHIDHINGKPSDNRIDNLRDVTRSQNLRNAKTPTTNKSGVIGVSRDGGKWVARIAANGKYLNLGRFDCIDAASDARKRAEKRYGYHANHGRF